MLEKIYNTKSQQPSTTINVAISHILMQKFEHIFFFKTVFYKYLLNKKKFFEINYTGRK
jgi:hypothetical protein